MEKIKLNENVSISPIVQGFWHLTDWNWTIAETIEFIEQCIALGVTTFDTAEIYGNYACEERMGEVLRAAPHLRDRIQIVTKTGINMFSDQRPYTLGHYDTRKHKVVASCQESIEKMNCDYLDVFLIHREDPVIDHKELGKTLDELVDSGWVKAVGVSNFDPMKFDVLQSFMKHKLVINQIECSPVCFEHFNNGNMDYLQKMDVRPMIWSPLASGRIFTSGDEKHVRARKKIDEIARRHGVESESIVFAWHLYHPVKAIPISGSRKIKRLKNALAGLNIALTHEEWFEIYTASGQQRIR
ncbi:MAG: aldo/keto reductase [Erysipelotrichaceae bacterium]|nr:aldo/keto reductase [Erysipelotrichaceae bacterium]MDP3306462.1 aldo/keto reductase [Erysipelotrichaceae bacterium]